MVYITKDADSGGWFMDVYGIVLPHLQVNLSWPREAVEDYVRRPDLGVNAGPRPGLSSHEVGARAQNHHVGI